MTGRRPTITLVVALTVLGLAAGWWLRPTPSRLPDDAVGDAELATLARDTFGADRPALAVAVITPEGTRSTVIGAPTDARFEAGSISKGVTGLLLTQAIERGEVAESTTVAEVVPELADAPVGPVTLRQLATHTSGLPVQAPTVRQLGRNLWAQASGDNPYDAGVEATIAELAGVPLTAPPSTYSNLGFELLGIALARAADTSYPELVAERVLTPLGMTSATYPVTDADLGPLDVVGENENGRRMDPWVGAGMAPAGGLRADLDDLTALARGVLDGTAPGVEATDPQQAFDDDQIGWGWITSETDDGATVVWHNGGTGGFASYLGVDRERGTAVVVLSATSASVTADGSRLLAEVGER